MLGHRDPKIPELEYYNIQLMGVVGKLKHYLITGQNV